MQGPPLKLDELENPRDRRRATQVVDVEPRNKRTHGVLTVNAPSGIELDARLLEVHRGLVTSSPRRRPEPGGPARAHRAPTGTLSATNQEKLSDWSCLGALYD